MKITVSKTHVTVSKANPTVPGVRNAKKTRKATDAENVEHLTSGMIGESVEVEFSEDWNGLTKVAIFTNGEVIKDVENPSKTVKIPCEVLATPNKTVSVGFYGYTIKNGEKVFAIPTIYADLGTVRKGADPSSDPSTEVSPTVAEQLQAEIDDLTECITNIKEQSGDGTTDHRELEHRDAANQHPISAITGLPEVLAGKGTYSKPAGGIPETDLASSAKESLGKADTALQGSALLPYRTASDQDDIDAVLRANVNEVDRKTGNSKRKIENFEAIAEGLLFREETVEGTDYIKTITDDVAPWATIDSIGGHSEVVEGEIVSAIVDKVVSVGRNRLPNFVDATFTQNGVTVTVSGNHVEMSGTATGGSFNHNFSLIKPIKVNGTWHWHFHNTESNGNVTVGLAGSGNFYATAPQNRIKQVASSGTFTAINIYVANNRTVNMTCDLSIEGNDNITDYASYMEHTYTIPEAVKALDGYGEGNTDSYNYLDLEAKKFVKVGYWVDGVWAELESPIETDISEHLTEENVLDVEPNGTATFEQDNDTQLTVPNTMTFVVDLGNYLTVEIENKVASNQGIEHANEILVVDSNGKVTTKSLDALFNL